MKNFFLALLNWFRPAKSDAARIAVQYATLRWLEGGKKGASREDRAALIRAVIEQVKTMADGTSDVSFIGGLIRSRLPTDMPAADRLLAEELISVVESNVGALTLPDQAVRLSEVLGWVANVLPSAR